jgi:hypothetical protein
MDPSVSMDMSPDYLQFAAQNPGFPVGFDDKVGIFVAAAVRVVWYRALYWIFFFLELMRETVQFLMKLICARCYVRVNSTGLYILKHFCALYCAFVCVCVCLENR